MNASEVNVEELGAPASAWPTLAISEAIATITLCRPEQHNRIDPEDIPVVMAHLDEIERNAAVRTIVFTGSGSKTFCSGYTIGAIKSRLDCSFENMLDRVEKMALPTICALNGSVYGGGTDFALCCDFRIGVIGSRMFMPAAKFGLHYYPGGLRRFVNSLGPTFTKKLFLTGQVIGAAEMLRVGYLNELVPASGLSECVNAYVDAIVAGEAAAMASMKHHIDGLAAGTWSEAAGREAYQASLASPEVARRLALLD